MKNVNILVFVSVVEHLNYEIGILYFILVFESKYIGGRYNYIICVYVSKLIYIVNISHCPQYLCSVLKNEYN